MHLINLLDEPGNIKVLLFRCRVTVCCFCFYGYNERTDRFEWMFCLVLDFKIDYTDIVNRGIVIRQDICTLYFVDGCRQTTFTKTLENRSCANTSGSFLFLMARVRLFDIFVNNFSEIYQTFVLTIIAKRNPYVFYH